MANSNTTFSLLATSAACALCAGTHANAAESYTEELTFSATSFASEGVNTSWSSLSSPSDLTDPTKYESWTISFTYTQASISTSFNDWGTAILATGLSAIENSYTNGFQIYWLNGSNSSGGLVVKCGGANSEKTLVSADAISSTTQQTLYFVLTYSLSGSLKVTVSNLNDTENETTSLEISTTLNQISSLSSALASSDAITDLKGYATLVAVPEPSAFGLLAGLGALGVGIASSRRRRKHLRQ